MRVEHYVEDDRYVIRVELPGIDPAKDVKIAHLDGALRLAVSRTEKHKETVRSEFHYGSFARTIALPAGVDENAIEATYEAGILTIGAEIRTPDPLGRPIKVKVGAAANGKKN